MVVVTKKIGERESTNKTSPPIIYHYLEVSGRRHLNRGLLSKEYSEYRRQWEENPQRGVVSEFPLYLNVEASGNCIGNCTYCFRTSRRTGVGDMGMNLFKKVVDEGSEKGLYALNPSFLGESTMHPELPEMIQYAKEQGILDVALDTNGFFVDKKMAEELTQSGLDRIIFSVDAVTEEKYNRIKYPFDLRKVSENINNLMRLKEKRVFRNPHVTIQMKEGLGESREEMMAFVDYWANRADAVRVSQCFYQDGQPYRKNKADTFSCPQPWQRLVIAWDGEVYPCLGDNACRMPLGNVNDNSIEEIWHGEEMEELRKRHRTNNALGIEICDHCNLNEVPVRARLYGKGIGDENE